MFHKEHFCHVASTNRGCPQYSIYVYKTTDSVETMLAEGYFNGALLDLHKNDVIIAEIISDVDAEQFDLVFFRVVSRTLEHVSVERTIIDKDILDKFVKKSGDTMTGDLRFSDGDEEFGFIDAAYTVDGNPAIRIVVGGISYIFNDIGEFYTYPEREGFTRTLGTNGWHWENIYVKKINNGADITIPSVKGTITLNEVNFQTPITDTNKGATMKEIEEVQTRETIDNKITNCVLQIPQNINLELNNGTLTLKAGSKVYFPDGSFVNINSDKTMTPRNTNQIYVVDRSGNPVQWALNGTYSGDTAPTAQQYMLWFDTANNIIKRSADTGATWTGNYSFPIGIFGPDDNENLAIKQVFNGFGFIGNSIFALPGVVALTPNGRNEDGSLNNTKVIVSNVIVRTFQNTLSQNTALYISNTYISTLKAPGNYNFETNYNMNGQNVFNACHIGTCQLTQGTVSNFMIKNTFRAVDYWGFNKLVKEVGNAAKLDAPNNFTSTNNSFANQILIRQNNGFAPVNIGYNSNGTQFSIHSVLSSGRGATVGVDADGTYCSMPTPDSDGDNIANTAWVRDLIERILGTMDYPVYWDYADATDHSHAMPGVQLDAETHQWYVYYKSGRVRQGGTYVNQETRNGNSHVMVTFPVEMANIYYEFQPSGVITSNGDYGALGGVTNDARSTTQASLYFCDYVGTVTIPENYMSWSVDGMAADGPKNVTF